MMLVKDVFDMTLLETIPLHPIENEKDYKTAISAINHLLDLGGANENNSLARWVTALGGFIESYEKHKTKADSWSANPPTL